MASTREGVLEAIKGFMVVGLEARLPCVSFERNRPKARRDTDDGAVVMRDGDPGEADIDFSPRLYNYQHRIPLEVLVYENDDVTREAALDAILVVLGGLIEENRFLGGLTSWLDVEAPSTEDLQRFGAETGRTCDAVIVAHYATSNPLA